MSHNSTDRSEFRFGKESKNVNFDRDYPDGERRALFRQYEFAHARQHVEPPENDEWNRDRSHINQDIRTSVQPARDSNRTEYRRAIGLGIGLASVVAENVLSHPFIMLRRQCQLHYNSVWFHLTPFTLVQPLFNIQRHQGLGVLWKGIGSSLMVRGMTVATETILSEVTQLPKEVGRHRTLKNISEHLLLKGMTVIVLTPFLASSLIECVQSEIASEKPGALDWLKEGAGRMMYINTPQMTRLLPVWKLFLPTVVFGLSHYIILSIAKHLTLLSVRYETDRPSRGRKSIEPAPPVQRNDYHYPELLATFVANLLADMVLYPLETVLHRLQVQGTRTIIDNMDTGMGVVPIITRYEGMFDCFQTIIRDEGLMALYKGFGALVMQYTIHVALLKLTRFVFEKCVMSSNGRQTSIDEIGLPRPDDLHEKQ